MREAPQGASSFITSTTILLILIVFGGVFYIFNDQPAFLLAMEQGSYSHM